MVVICQWHADVCRCNSILLTKARCSSTVLFSYHFCPLPLSRHRGRGRPRPQPRCSLMKYADKNHSLFRYIILNTLLPKLKYITRTQGADCGHHRRVRLFPGHHHPRRHHRDHLRPRNHRRERRGGRHAAIRPRTLAATPAPIQRNKTPGIKNDYCRDTINGSRRALLCGCHFNYQ